MKPFLSVVLSAALALPFSASVYADAAADRGLDIARDRKQRDEGWGTSEAQLTMTLRNAEGEESVREIRTRSLEVKDDGDKGLTIFDAPKDVKGTAFLNYSHVSKPDDQWLYLPALKRVKRIASRNKSGPFMGSEFAYEDMSSFELEKYQFRYVRDDMVDGHDCYVVEQTPLDEFSGYTKQIVWLDKEHLRGFKIEFYDRKQSLLKTLTLGDYQLYKDKYWRAHTATMVNHQTGKSTVLKTLKLAFDTGLTDADFNETTLMRAR